MPAIPHIDPDIRKASTLPGTFYTAPEVYELQKSTVFQATWQWVAGRQAAGRPGQVYPFELLPGCLDEPLLLSHGEDKKVRCLSNVCTHRGNLLVNATCSPGAIRCRYHGRRFALDGKMEFMPGFEETEHFPSEQDHLPEVPLQGMLGHIFTSLRPQVSFREWAKPMVDRIGWMPVHTFTLDSTRSNTYRIQANWALYVDNYLEGFHIPFIHGASLAPALEKGTYATTLFPYGSLQTALAREGEPVFDIPEGAPDHGQKIAAYYFWLFPNIMFNFYPWGLSMNIVQPEGPQQTRVLFLTYIWKPQLLDQGAGKDLHLVEMEDEEVVLQVQKGVGASLYHRGRYSATEEKGVHHFHRLLTEFMQQ